LLLEGYQSVPSGIKQVASASQAWDFRPVTALRLGPYPTLEKVNEHGEVKSGTIAQTKKAYELTTDGRIFAITRTALINDDLGAFSDLVRRYGTARYLFASPAVTPVIRYSKLEGNTSPQVETKEGFEIPGIAFLVLHDFGAGIVDYRGTFKNPAA